MIAKRPTCTFIDKLNQNQGEKIKKILWFLAIPVFLLMGSQALSQGVGSAECGMAQQAAQGAVASGGPYNNQGQMVKTAAQAVNPYLYEGVISEECHSCIVSQFARRIPISEQESCGPATNWLITFTNRGTLLPEMAIEFMCNTAKSEIILWLHREANKYQHQVPVSNISCLEEQFFLTGDLIGQCPQWCLNDAAVIGFLEGSFDSIKDAKFTTVVHYLDDPESPFYDHDYNIKYDFYFFRRWPDSPFPFYPPLDVNSQGESLIHELMHKMGASDKYYDGPEQACKIDPATGQQYSGYDIMCHRIADPTGGYFFPPLSELIISDQTAKEIGWLSY